MRGSNKKVTHIKNNNLKPLPTEPPTFLEELEQEVWVKVIVPLINQGILKETDHYSCVAYCELATFKITELSSSQATHLAKLREQLGLTPVSRLRVSQAATGKESANIADVLELHVS